MKTDLPGFWQGSVDIEIKGKFSERFLNLAFQEGIKLSCIENNDHIVYARVPLRDVKKLRSIAKNSQCSFHIRKRRGIPFVLDFCKRRPLLPLMMAVLIFLFFFVSSFVFTLEVSGPYPVAEEDAERVLELAEKYGLEQGHSRWGLDMDEIEHHILLEFKELVFAQIIQDGVHVRIDVVRRVDVQPDEAQKAPGNLVADFDGIIEDILVRRGTAAVSPGDAVCKGDILIYGWQGEQQMAADGIVTARVWTDGYGECALKEEQTEPSGREVVGIGLRVGDGAFLHLAGAQESPFAEYEVSESTASTLAWRNTGTAVEIVIRNIRELLTTVNEYTWEEAEKIAKERAEAAAYNQLLQLVGEDKQDSLQIIDKQVENINLDENTARAHAVWESKIPIGVYAPFNEEAYL